MSELPLLSVHELTLLLKQQIEEGFYEVLVAGEISNLSRPSSGHLYLTLKDSFASLRGVIWRSTASRIPFDIEDGLEIIAKGSLEVYAPRGTYQIVIREVIPQGVGALERALRKLKEKLDREGLFDPSRRRRLPRFPKKAALITSPSGAAIRDFLKIAERRYPGTDFLILPVRVQGEEAGGEIAQALELANQHRQEWGLDTIVLTRGGGSLEDLWAFNEEPVVRAIAASKLPVISAVGHEIDITLADLAADLRALTPTDAGERLLPDRETLLSDCQMGKKRLRAGLLQRLKMAQSRVENLQQRPAFRRPYSRIHDETRRLDEASQRMLLSIRQKLRQAEREQAHLADQLDSLSPLAVLARGYSLTWKKDEQRPLTSTEHLKPGELLRTQLANGQVISRIESIESTDGIPDR
ncbi:Exodeoxyribonuclease VII large subunit [Planctomycetales bacterium 10988]|nr:Exodeoxyribonuclease VII large subunit [Planctomycetales bacterium 10988]